MINLCCNFKLVADVLKDCIPEIAEFYNIIDFGKVYKKIDDTRVVRSVMDHFKPKEIFFSSAFGSNLPFDLLGAFTLNSPQTLNVKFHGLGQNFLVKPTKIEKLHIENCYYDDSSLATNAILQSSKRLCKIKIVNGCIDDITSAIIGRLGLENFEIKNVKIRCEEMEWFVINLTKQAFMTELRLRYFGDINMKFLSLLLDRIGSMNLTALELSLGKTVVNLYSIKRSDH